MRISNLEFDYDAYGITMRTRFWHFAIRNPNFEIYVA